MDCLTFVLESHSNFLRRSRKFSRNDPNLAGLAIGDLFQLLNVLVRKDTVISISIMDGFEHLFNRLRFAFCA